MVQRGSMGRDAARSTTAASQRRGPLCVNVFQAVHWKEKVMILRSIGAFTAALVLSLTAEASLAQETKPKLGPDSQPKKEATGSTAGKIDAAVAALEKHIGELESTGKIDRATEGWKARVPGPPPAVVFTPNASYFWHVQTNFGTVKVKFDPELAPQHVTHFMFLTLMGFYDGLKFHRVIPGFMAQGGCPLGTGSGGPRYRLGLEVSAKTKHDKRGVVSTARTQAPNSDGSQFFMMFAPAKHLDPKPSSDGVTGGYTVFGMIVDGIETLDELEKRGSAGGPPSEPLLIERAWITVE